MLDKSIHTSLHHFHSMLYNFQQSHTKLYKFIEQTKSPHHILSVRSEDTTNVKEKSLHRYDTTNNYNQLVVTESSIKHRWLHPQSLTSHTCCRVLRAAWINAASGMWPGTSAARTDSARYVWKPLLSSLSLSSDMSLAPAANASRPDRISPSSVTFFFGCFCFSLSSSNFSYVFK